MFDAGAADKRKQIIEKYQEALYGNSIDLNGDMINVLIYRFLKL